MASINWDIFAKDHSSKELDKMARRFDKATKDFRNFGNSAASSFAKTANALSNIPTAAAALQGVSQIVVGLSGVLGLVPAAAAAAGASIATLAVGTMGFGDALKELGSPAKAAGGVSGVADAAAMSARRIADAERTLTRAQQDARDAQEELTRARKRAAEQIEDLQHALAGAALDEESAVLAVERAQERLADARKEGAKGLDLREAELGLKQAQQSLVETRERYKDLRTEAGEAAKAGVEGSDEVIAAQRRVTDAAEGVQDAQRGVAEAHEDAARSASKAGAAAGGATEAFDKLSKNAKETALAIIGLSGAWTQVRHTVQDALFAGVADDVKLLGGTYLPVVEKGMAGVAEEFNKGARSTAAFLAEGRQVKDVGSIFAGTKTIAGEFSATLRPITAILLDITAVGMEVLTELTGGFGNAAESAAAFVRNARETGQLREWIEKGLETVRKLGELFSNIGSIISTVFSGLNAGGKNFLDTMIAVTGKVDAFLKSAEGQEALKALGSALNAVSAVVTDVFIEALKALGPIIVELAPGFAEFTRQVGDVLIAAIRVVGPLLGWLAGLLSDNMDWLGPLAIALYGLVKAFEALRIILIAVQIAAMVNPFILIATAVIALAILIITHWEEIKKALAAAWEWIKSTAGNVWTAIKAQIVRPITETAQWIADRFNGLVSFFADLPSRIGRALGSLGGFIGDAFKSGVNAAISLLNWGIDRINNLIYGINVISPADDIPYIRHIGFLAKGGPALANMPYVVGEKGPELFVPNMSGMVIPNHKLDTTNPMTPGNWGPSPSYAVPRGSTTTTTTGPMVVKVELVTSPSASGEVGNLITHLVRTRQIQLRVNGQQVVAP